MFLVCREYSEIDDCEPLIIATSEEKAQEWIDQQPRQIGEFVIKDIPVYGALEVAQIVRIKGDPYIRKILDIRGDDALTTGADLKTGYIPLDRLEPVPESELEEYRKHILNT